MSLSKVFNALFIKVDLKINYQTTSECNVLSRVTLSNVVPQLGQQVTVGDGCVVSVFCVLDKEDHLDNMTVVYGPGNQRRKQQDKPMVCYFRWF